MEEAFQLLQSEIATDIPKYVSSLSLERTEIIYGEIGGRYDLAISLGRVRKPTKFYALGMTILIRLVTSSLESAKCLT